MTMFIVGAALGLLVGLAAEYKFRIVFKVRGK